MNSVEDIIKRLVEMGIRCPRQDQGQAPPPTPTRDQGQTPPPTPTRDQIYKSICMDQALFGQETYIKHLMAKAATFNAEEEYMETTNLGRWGFHSLVTPPSPFAELRRCACTQLEILDLASAPNQVLWGKYFLCQTISVATMDVRGLEVIVTDPKGAAGIRMILYNYTAEERSILEVNFDDILPPGMFLVVKNPWFFVTPSGWLVLHVDNPAEVELVSRKRMEAKFPGIVWNGEIPTEEIDNLQKRSFWKELKGDDAATLAKLKGLGNKGFVEKRFSDAIRFYDMALDYCNGNREDEVRIHSNKSAALLALGCFNTAIVSAELALEIDPASEKCVYRKTKAMIGLRKYEEAASFLGAKFDQFPSLNKNKDCKKLLENVQFLASRKVLGPTDSQLLSIYTKTLMDNEDNIPEFIGPLTVTQIEGKGRGLIATQDIHIGQLVICTKAFAYQATPPQIQQMIRTIANKLTFDPELGSSFYNLTGMDGLGHLEPDDWKNRHVDMRRILNTVKINIFGTSLDPAQAQTGLWLAPSMLNHSCCEDNCTRNICGEVMTVRAIAEIKKGEELLLSYTNPIFPPEIRHARKDDYGFTCACSLCELDASEPNSVRNERNKILKHLEQLTTVSDPEELQKGLEGVKKLGALRRHAVALNYPLISLQVKHFLEILIGKGTKARDLDAISVLKRMFKVATVSSAWNHAGIDVALCLKTCYEATGDEDLAKLWMTTAKSLIMKLFGGLEPVRQREEGAAALLKKIYRVDFFKDD